MLEASESIRCQRTHYIAYCGRCRTSVAHDLRSDRVDHTGQYRCRRRVHRQTAIGAPVRIARHQR